MRKLLVLPGHCTSMGGMTVSLALMVKGFERCGASEQICVLVRANTLMEEYLVQAGLSSCLHRIQAKDQRQFTQLALQWVSQQPRDWPLLLENCLTRQVLLKIAIASPALRLAGRPVYYIFRDLALSYNRLGNLARNLVFACLAPRLLCNSKFTASHIHNRLGKVQEVLYPPVDSQKFNDRPSVPPKELQPILDSGAKLMLTVSRISEPGKFNDKNLRALIPVLAHLKAIGHHYHAVVIGQDTSVGHTRTRALIEQARSLGVADRFTVLPPTFAIEDYYKHADIVVTLAPREPFGRTVVEAIACGVPVVGSCTGGIGETLHHFAPQWAVDPNDSVAVAEAIINIACDPNTSGLLIQGKRWVEAHCNIVNYARRTIAIVGLDSNSLHRTHAELLHREEYTNLHLRKIQ